jgi:transposase
MDPARQAVFATVGQEVVHDWRGERNRVIGLDIAKSVFQIHGADRQGRAVHKRLRRGQMEGYFAQLKPCVVGIEATQGAHYWTRVLTARGHSVRLISPHFVKPFLKSQKNDANDAEAICEAVSRPSMRFVPAMNRIAAQHSGR